MKNLISAAIAIFTIMSSVVPSGAALAQTSTGSGSASVSAVAPVANPPAIAMKDWKFSRNMALGTKGADVTELQKFLTEQGFYAGPVTGGYYQLTMQAVQKFQKANGVEATGYFGLKSRGVANGIRDRLVNFICPNDASGCTIPAPSLSIVPEGDLSTAVGASFNVVFRVSGGSQTFYDIKGMGEVPGLQWNRSECPPGAYCVKGPDRDSISLVGTPRKAGIYTVTVMAREDVVSPCKELKPNMPCPMLYPQARYGKASFTIVVKGDGTTSAPVLKGVKGPAELKVSEEGTWTIQATGKGSLAYSVVWGDEMPDAMTNSMKAGASMQFIQTATFSHRYQNPGLYTAIFKVADEQGNVATASLGVKVGDVLVMTGGSIVIEPEQTILRPGREAKLAAYYQPPMPPCPQGMFCAQMMPPRIAVRANWRTSNPDVVSLREPNCVSIGVTSGVENCQNVVYVMGVKPGTATVTAMYEAGGQQFAAKTLINVLPFEKSGRLILSPSSAAINVGGSANFTALYEDPLPDCAYVMPVCDIAYRAPYPVAVDWYLDNPSVAALSIAVADCAPIPGAPTMPCRSFTSAQLIGLARGTATLSATYIRGDGSPKVDAKATVTVN
jgi:peptidoglycan hydrolase-like protein with peptidoglycan-binding domain